MSGGIVLPKSITRVADTNAYLANDVIGTSTASGGAVHSLTFPSQYRNMPLRITNSEFEHDATALISGESSYRAHFYNATPGSALVDNNPFDIPSGDRASYLGYVDLGTPVDLGSTLYVQAEQAKDIKLSGVTLYFYLVTIAAYTPASAAVYKATLHFMPWE